MSNNHFSRKKRQLKNSVKKLNVLLESENSKLNTEINKLISKTNSLLKQLNGLIDGREVKKILGSLIVFFSISFNAEAQNFAPSIPQPDIAPWPLVNGRVSSVIDFCDIDNDGDYDLFSSVFSYYYTTTIYFQQNVGSPSSEVFSIPIQNQFNIESLLDTVNINSQGCVGRWGMTFNMEFVDIDSDGDYDLFGSGIVFEQSGPPSCTGNTYFTSTIFYENTGNANAPNFASPVLNPFGLDAGAVVSGYAEPIEFVDIDNDGDLDLLSVEYSYGAYFFDVVFSENIGSSTSPQFTTTTNNLAVGPIGQAIHDIEAVDINNDGDFDLFAGGYGGSILYYENSGSSSSPNLSPPATSPFNLSIVGNDDGDGNLNIKFCDIDDDGDEDFFWVNPEDILYHDTSWFFQENISPPSNSNEIYVDQNIAVYPNPTNGILNIEFSIFNNQDIKLNLLNTIGEVIFTESSSNYSGEYSHQINLEDNAKGIYFLEIETNDGVINKKLVLQ
ncbi:MAG: T9SS type A sorting domain-containing protein [Bacteroidota bacterium]|nr:T9SS type A sorting domain-containing protein [Bacteroidota bacterium]